MKLTAFAASVPLLLCSACMTPVEDLTDAPDAAPLGAKVVDAGNPYGGDDGGQPRGYPPEPYGTRVGDTLANLALPGYLDKKAEWAEVDLSDFYDPDGARGYKLLVIEVGARWCTFSRILAQLLSLRCNEHRARGLACYTAIFQDELGNAADPVDVDWWRLNFQVDDAIVLDHDFKWHPYFGDENATPLSMYVDPRSMRILQIDHGFSLGTVDSAIQTYLNR